MQPTNQLLGVQFRARIRLVTNAVSYETLPISDFLSQLKILPLWFLGFVCFKFIEFVATSNFTNNHYKLSKNPFIFDKIGRIVSAMFFIIPGITCIYKYLMPYNEGYLINILLYIIFVAVLYSSYLRIKSCYILVTLVIEK